MELFAISAGKKAQCHYQFSRLLHEVVVEHAGHHVRPTSKQHSVCSDCSVINFEHYVYNKTVKPNLKLSTYVTFLLLQQIQFFTLVNIISVPTLLMTKNSRTFQDLIGARQHLNIKTNSSYLLYIQCESKKIPPRFSGIFSQMVGDFLSKFYTPVTCSYLR